MTSTPSPVGIALPVPDAWAPALAEFDADRKLAGRPATSRSTYQGNLRHYARWATGGPFEQTRADLRRYMAQHLDTWRGETARSRRQTLVGFYDWALREEYMEVNPARQLPTVKAQPPAPRPASDIAFLSALGQADPRLQLMIHCGADLGLRSAEIAQLHSRDLRAVGGRLLVTVHGKGGKDRTLPCPPLIASMLRALPEGWVFPSSKHPSGHLAPRTVSKLLTKSLPGDLTGHTLRHRFATNTYNREHDLLLVSEMLGHTNTAITQNYVLPDNLDRMAAAIDRNAAPFPVASPPDEDPEQLAG